MTIRELVMASMVALALGGCSVTFASTPSASPGNNYGYDWGGKPISSVDHHYGDGKPLHRGSTPKANDPDDEPASKPSAPQDDEPAQRKKPPRRTKPTDPDTRPDTDRPPTRRPVDRGGQSLDPDDHPPTRRPVDRGGQSLDPDDHRPTRRPVDRGGQSLDPDDKPPTRRPVDRGTALDPDKAPTRRPVDGQSLEPSAGARKPTPRPVPTRREGAAQLDQRGAVFKPATKRSIVVTR
jgi:hypothetical protein